MGSIKDLRAEQQNISTIPNQNFYSPPRSPPIDHINFKSPTTQRSNEFFPRDSISRSDYSLFENFKSPTQPLRLKRVNFFHNIALSQINFIPQIQIYCCLPPYDIPQLILGDILLNTHI